MIRAALVLAAGAAAALAGAASASSAAPPPNMTCDQVTQTFSGTAYDLTVPANGYCDIENATITHDLIVRQNSGGDLTNTTIGHDARYADESGGDITGTTIGDDLSFSREGGANIFQSTIGHDLTEGFDSGLQLAAVQVGHNLIANKPNTVQTGCSDPTAACHVQVANNFVIDGSPGPPDPGAFVFDGMCDLSVGHDLRITNRWVTLGIGLGDGCAGFGSGPISVGHDLVFSHNSALTGFFGPGGMGVVDASVGHDLTFSHNSATGSLQVAENTVTRNATCRDNSPAASLGPFGPNSVGGTNDGCP